ncbi:MAG: hypothetical protein PUD64_05285, partial [Bacteroidales bacterium]|nr:hypothetical protein [Bacteroidales bacterium]
MRCRSSATYWPYWPHWPYHPHRAAANPGAAQRPPRAAQQRSPITCAAQQRTAALIAAEAALKRLAAPREDVVVNVAAHAAHAPRVARLPYLPLYLFRRTVRQTAYPQRIVDEPLPHILVIAVHIGVEHHGLAALLQVTYHLL